MTEEAINQTLDQVTGTLLQEPVKFDVTLNPKGRVRRYLTKHGILPKVKECEIPPLCLGARMQISRELRKIPTFREKGIVEINHIISDEHTEGIAKIIAIAMRNQLDMPSRREINFVLQNITSEDQQKLFMIIIRQLNISPFVSSTALIKGAGLLEKPEIIAGNQNEKKNRDSSTPGQSQAV